MLFKIKINQVTSIFFYLYDTKVLKKKLKISCSLFHILKCLHINFFFISKESFIEKKKKRGNTTKNYTKNLLQTSYKAKEIEKIRKRKAEDSIGLKKKRTQQQFPQLF